MSFRLKHPRPPRATENDIERGCLDYLRLRGYWVTRVHAGTLKSADGLRWIKAADKGTPDYTLTHEFYPGFLMEVKRPGASPTPDQERKIREITVCYRLAVAVIDSVEDLTVWLADHELRAKRYWAKLRSNEK